MSIDPFSIALEIAFGKAAEYPVQAVSKNFKNKKTRKKIVAEVAHLVGFSDQQFKTLSYVTDDSEFVRVFHKGDFRSVGRIAERHGLLLGDITAERLGQAFKDAYRNVVIEEADQAQALLLQDAVEIKQDTAEIKEAVLELSTPAPSTTEPKFPQFVGVPDRDRLFVGRSEELGELSEVLSGGGSGVVVSQVASGLGGVGKTSLVAELCHRYRGEFGVVRWLVADDRQGLVESFLSVAPAVGVSVDGLDVGDAVARVRGWFERTERRWLLVFDNAEDPAVLEGLVPGFGNGSVVITSRRRDWSSFGLEPLELGVLDRESAVELLVKRSGVSSDVGAGVLVDYLGCLALAVTQAAAYCKQQGWLFTRYLEMLEQRPERLFAVNAAELKAADESDKVMLTVWDASIEQAVDASSKARDVLNVASFFAADAIPDDLVTSEGSVEVLGLDVLDVAEALGALRQYSLLDRSAAGLWSMHRLTQSVTHASLDEQGRAECFGEAVACLEAVHPRELTTPETWETAAPYGVHVLSVVSHSEKLETGRAAVGVLLDRHATSIQNQGEPLRAVPLFEQAKDLTVAELDDEHPSTLRAWANLALSYWSAGRTSEAIEILERVAERSEELLGAEHPDTLRAWANLASSYWSAGRVGESIEILERVAERSEELLGAEHPSTLTRWANLAGSYRSAGRTSEAIEILERVAERSEELLGAEHPDTLTRWANLASSYWSAGRVGESIEILERVAERSEELLGAEHPSTLTRWANLASSYWSAGRTSEAIEIEERVAERSEELLGAEHPSTLRAWANLALSYWSAGRTSEAIEIEERVAERSEELLGAEHPDTLTRWANLASSYWSAGRVGESIEILERVAERSEELLGAERPSTLTRWANLAGSYWSAGRVGESIEILERVAERSEELLGAEHPDTLRAWANLASSYRSADRTGDAQETTEAKLRWLLDSDPKELDPAQANVRRQILEVTEE